MIGFHLQRPIDSWVEAAKKLPAGTPIKFIDNVQALAEIKAHKPDIFTVLRHFYDNRQIFGGDYEHRKNVAREFFATFIDGTFENYASAVNAIEDWNEYIANSHTTAERNERILHARAMAEVWKNEYRNQQKYAHIRLILANAAIGNDVPVEYAQIAQQYDCIIGYHAYIHYTAPKVIDPLDWRYHSGRWVAMDAQYKAAGYHNTKWIFTEGGPYVGVYEGWKHEKTCQGDIDCYMAALEYWLNQATDWNKQNNGRAIGITLYNSGDAKGQWKYFENDSAIMNKVADLQSSFNPPSQDWRLYAWEKSIEVQIESGLSLNPKAALQAAILADRMNIVTSEYWDTDPDGIQRAYMVAEDPAGIIPRRIYFAIVPEWNNIQYITDPKSDQFSSAWVWPTTQKIVTQQFGANPQNYEKYGYPGHNGIDLAAPLNSLIFAAWPGRVTWASNQQQNGDGLSDYGYHVKIDHGNRLSTLYAHLRADIEATVGETVFAGQTIGYSGNTGNSTGPHLHLEIRLCPGENEYKECQRNPWEYLRTLL